MEPALHELALAQAELAKSIDDLEIGNKLRAAEAAQAERRRNRRSWGTLAVVVVLAVVGWTNRTVLNRIEDVTGPNAQARSAVSTQAILAQNAVETDCRSRRQQARLPAPPAPPHAPPRLTPAGLARFLAPYACAAVTDPAVYPGIKGEPTRP